jgi:putative PEP-CTERM system TPR-repeat lipoprotein
MVMLVLPIVACGFLGMDDAELVKSAKQYLTKDDLGAAAIELRNALQKNPDNAEARYILGTIYMDVGDVSTAEKEFRKAVSSGWNEGEANIGLARALLQKNDTQTVLSEITVKATYSDNIKADLTALRAAAEMIAGNTSQANDTFAKAEQFDANAYQVMKTRAQLQFLDKKIDVAKESLENALKKYPGDAELLLTKSKVAILEKDAATASAIYQQIIESEPQKIITAYARIARLGLARLKILGDELELAEKTLQPLFSRSDKDPEVNYLGGMLAFKQNQYDLAAERLLKVLQVAPDHPATELLFGTVSFAQKNYEQASHYLGKYLAAAPQNIGARKLLGRTQMMLGLHQEAQDTLKPGLTGKSDDAELLALIGLTDLQKGNTQAGILGLQKAVAAAPESAALHGELAKAYISAGETDEAIKELQGIIEKGGEKNKAEALLISAYLRSKQNDLAISTAKEMLARNPEDPAINALVGNVYAVVGDQKTAKEYLVKALQLKPDFVQAALLLGSIEEQSGNVDGAIQLYKRLIDADVNSNAPMLALARHASKNKNSAEMIEWLEKAIVKKPEDVRPRVILAEHYLKERQSDKAEAIINSGLSKTESPVLMSLQAKVMVFEGRYNEALKPLNTLVEKLPNAVLPRVQLAEVYLRLGQQKEALKHLNVALEKGSDYIPALALKTKIHLNAGQADEALALANKIRNLNPDAFIGYELAGDAWDKKKNYAKAETFFGQAWERKKSPSLALKYSNSMSRSGKKEAAYQPVLTWLEKEPNNVMLLTFMGMAYQNQKENDNAILQYEKILATDPKNSVALNNLAWLYLSIDKSKAVTFSERAYKTKPKDPGILDTYGWALVQQGEAKKGRRLLKEALDKMPNVADIRYHYAVALIQSGDKDEGQNQLNALLNEGKPFEGMNEAKQLVAQ